jgi:hypothetical protein
VLVEEEGDVLLPGRELDQEVERTGGGGGW